jgi:hypothetical protein
MIGAPKPLHKLRIVLIAAASLGTSACGHPPPERACVDHANLQTLFGMFFDNAERAVDAFAADKELQNPAALKLQLRALSRQSPIEFNTATFEAFNTVTKAVTCNVVVNYHLAASDRSPEGKEAMAEIHGLDVPGDLLGDSPKSIVTFTVQPSPDGRGSIVTIKDSSEPTESLLIVAMARQKLAIPIRPL